MSEDGMIHHTNFNLRCKLTNEHNMLESRSSRFCLFGNTNKLMHRLSFQVLLQRHRLHHRVKYIWCMCWFLHIILKDRLAHIDMSKLEVRI